MAKIVCVLYDDPVDGYPTFYARDDPEDRRLSGRPDAPTPKAHRLQAGHIARQRLRRTGPAQIPRRTWPHVGRDLRQGRRKLGAREGTARRRDRHLAAVLAGLPDGGADRQGAEAEAGDHGRHRLGPRRSAGRHRARHHRGRSHLLQQHQRGRARGDDDPVAGAQLHPVVQVGDRQAAGTSPIAWRAPTTWKAWRSAPWRPAASAWRCCGRSSRSTSNCTTPTGTGCRRRSKRS